MLALSVGLMFAVLAVAYVVGTTLAGSGGGDVLARGIHDVRGD